MNAIFTSKEAKNRLADVFRAAMSGEAIITNHGKPLYRVVPMLDGEERENAQDRLDRVKHHISCEVLARHSLKAIRERSLLNLKRWREKGSWNPAYTEWLDILERADDQELIKIMVGLDELSNRLRQSMPFVGMLDQETSRRLREEA